MSENKINKNDLYTPSEKEEYEKKRHSRLVNTLLYICRVAGFEVVERIVLRDVKSGRVWH